MARTLHPIASQDVVVVQADIGLEGHARTVSLCQRAAIDQHLVQRVAVAIDISQATAANGCCFGFGQQLLLLPSGAKAIPEIGFGREGNVLVNLELGLAGPQVILERIQIEAVIGVGCARQHVGLGGAGHGRHVHRHNGAVVQLVA